MSESSGVKPLSEVLAGVYVNELHRLRPDLTEHWHEMPPDAQRAHMGAMHELVGALELFGLFIVERDGVLSVKRKKVGAVRADPAASKSRRTVLAHGSQSPTDIAPGELGHLEARQRGYTGNMCSECGSMHMTRNGSCEKCGSCGATTGCS